MALDIKSFAAVARATNALFFYPTTDAIATVEGAGYFNSKDLAGYVKVKDVIMANTSDKLAFFKVTAVNTTTGAITVNKAIA